MADKDPKKNGGSPAEAPAPLAPETSAAITRAEAAQIVEDWFNRTIPQSPASRTTECYNYLLRAKEQLQARLKGE